MMKKLILSFLCLFAAAAAMAQEPGLDEILAKYCKASAMDRLAGVKTMVMAGQLMQQDLMPYKITRMRPDRYLLEFDVADVSSLQGYDGTTAWFTAPYTGNPKAQTMPPDRAADIKMRADFDGPLVNWKAKGYQLEVAGTDTVGKEIAWKLKLTRKDGGTEYYSIGKTSGMLLKRQFSRMVRGTETKVEAVYRDYRMVDGIPFAFTIENILGGQPWNTVQFESITLNVPVEEKIFAMPAH